MPEYFRGYKITKNEGQYYFVDTGEPTIDTWKDRPCGHCGLYNTEQGHDGCLGELPGVINACCGHGVPEEAYIQFGNGERIGGKEAICKMENLKISHA